MENAAEVAINSLCIYIGVTLMWLFGRNMIVNTIPNAIGIAAGYAGIIFDSLCVAVFIVTTLYAMFWS